MPEFIQVWANAIAQFEGFNSPGSRPARNHNPGDLRYAGQREAIGKDSGNYAIFPDDATGFQALYAQLEKYVTDFPGYTLLEIMAHYLGQASPTVDAQGNAYTYANYIASSLGVSVNITLGELLAGAGAAPGPPPIPTDLASSSSSTDTTSTTSDGLPPPDPQTLLMLAIGVGLVLLVAKRFLG